MKLGLCEIPIAAWRGLGGSIAWLPSRYCRLEALVQHFLKQILERESITNQRPKRPKALQGQKL
jgi:hypothetical protein